jgi:lysophospholipase L1-like esterase
MDAIQAGSILANDFVTDSALNDHGRASATSSPRPIAFVKRCVFSMIPLLVLLAGAEIAARLFVTSDASSKRFEQIEQIIVYLGNEPGESIFEPDPDCFWRLKPNVTLPSERGETWGGMMSNSHGMRSREVSVADAQDRLRVLCFGDSSTFAIGVNFADAWPNQLQQLLDDERPGAVEVLNAGIPGQTTYQGRQRLTRELVKWRPHLAFITFGNNDGWRWDGTIDKEHARRSDLARRLSLLNHSRAWQWLTTKREQPDHTKSTREQLDWARSATWNYFDPNAAWTPRVSVEDFSENLRAMVRECRNSQCEPILIVWPDQRQLLGQPTWRLPYQAAMRQVANELGADCLDLVVEFEQSGDWAAQHFIPNDVVHVDRVGNRFVAEIVAKLVRPVRDNH